MNCKLLAVVSLIATLPLFSSAEELPYGKFFATGHNDKPYFALTFDDGPGASTGEILAVLDKYGAKATFFMLGSSVAQYPDLAKKIVQGGHLAGSHTYSHFQFKKAADAKQLFRLEWELPKTAAFIQNAGAPRPHFMRFPYGIHWPYMMEAARKHQFVVVNWDHGEDWFLKRSKEEMLKGYAASLRPGAIMLLHDGGKLHLDKTIWVTEELLKAAKKKGLTCVRVDTLLGMEQAAAAAAKTDKPLDPALLKGPVPPRMPKDFSAAGYPADGGASATARPKTAPPDAR